MANKISVEYNSDERQVSAMPISNKNTLHLGESVAGAKKKFQLSAGNTLPVLSEAGAFVGVIWCKDLLGLDSDQLVDTYISQDFLRLKPMMSDRELLRVCAEQNPHYGEAYIINDNGLLVDSVELLAMMNAKIQGLHIETEEEFLRQILRPTSLARCILDGLNDGVVLVDRMGLIHYANIAYGKILGVDHRRVINRLMMSFEPQSKIMEVITSGAPCLNQPITVRSVGVTVLANITPVFFREQIVGAVSVFADITEALHSAHEVEKSQIIRDVLKQELTSTRPALDGFQGIIGTARKLRKQLEMAAKVAPVDAPVLILGESGTGKELVAQAIHRLSPRKDLPFISLNCSAIPENLIESELFGYEDGAFTGSKKGGKQGKIDYANGGTLFLDEIGDMPLSMQTKLLRFLQEKEFERVGGLKSVRVDIRVVAATNKNLAGMVQHKVFREDLYYRLNVFTLALPPLRERRVDIIALIEHYQVLFAQKYGKQIEISAECLRTMLSYDWPGNIRELRNVMEHIVLLAEDLMVDVENLPEYFQERMKHEFQSNAQNTEPESLQEQIRQVEQKAILDALQRNGYNKTKAMDQLGLSRRTFYKRMKEMGIE
jgi:transcriptional regulator with PAS, ATPase and Fis domain